MVDFRVICVLLLHLLVMLLFFLPALLIEGLQVLAALVLLHHLVLFKLLVTFFVVVLQILRGLGDKKKSMRAPEFHTHNFL